MTSLKISYRVDYNVAMKWFHLWSLIRKLRLTKPVSKSLKTKNKQINKKLENYHYYNCQDRDITSPDYLAPSTMPRTWQSVTKYLQKYKQWGRKKSNPGVGTGDPQISFKLQAREVLTVFYTLPLSWNLTLI